MFYLLFARLFAEILYTCVFVFVFILFSVYHSFSNYKQKTDKMGVLFKANNFLFFFFLFSSYFYF